MLSPRNVEKLLARFHFLFQSSLIRDLRGASREAQVRGADQIIESLILLLSNLFLMRMMQRGPGDEWSCQFLDEGINEPDLTRWVELQRGLIVDSRVPFEDVFSLDLKRRDLLQTFSKRYLTYLDLVAKRCRADVSEERAPYDEFIEFLVNYFRSEVREDAKGNYRLIGRDRGVGISLQPLVRPVVDEVEVFAGVTPGGLRYRNLARGEMRICKDPALLRRFGEMCLGAGGYRQAVVLCHDLARDDEVGRCAVLAASGSRFLRKGSYREAAGEFERALRIRPDLRSLVFSQAQAHARLHDHPRAVQLVGKLVERDPTFDRGYEMLGDLFQLKGELVTSRRMYDKALAANPSNRSAERKRGLLPEERSAPKARPEVKRVAPVAQEAAGDAGRAHDLLVDLTKLAEEGSLGPVIGRDSEIGQIVEILACEMRSNPILIGEPGVGKTAIVEELAARMVRGDVPRQLQGKKLYMMSVASLLAGAKFRGQFEERVLQLIQQLKSEPCILFIDDIHTIVNSGMSKGGTLDTSSLLKPALVRGEIQAIGATTFDEYRLNFDKDPSLARSFQAVEIDEPEPEEMPELLAPHLRRLADHHRVLYAEMDLVEVARLVKVCLRERRLPDVAINVLDRAAARVCLEHAAAADPTPPLVTRDDVGMVLSEMSGVPVARLSDDQARRLLDMERILSDRVIGQAASVRAVAQVIRTAKMNLSLHTSRPNGVFLFVGPSGVGKTELARTLAEYLFGDEDKVIRIDMSEYMEKISSSRLIGTAPGYVGYNDQNQLTDQVRKSPYSVVLLDEIEKADSQMLNLFLQVFDAGRLTDGKGRTVNFSNTTIIMTSNVGTHLYSRARAGYSEAVAGGGQVSPSELMKEVKKFYPPEFLNRIDEVVLFRQLDEDDLIQITRVQLRDLTTRLARQGVEFQVSDDACRLLAREGYSQEFGARKLGRAIRRQVLDPLAVAALDAGWEQVTRVVVGARDGVIDLALHGPGPLETMELQAAEGDLEAAE